MVGSKISDHLGGKVPRRVVPAGDALPYRADEEDRPFTPRSSRTDPELFPCPETPFERCCRGPEQQSQSHYAKILWLSHVPLPRTRPLSFTWQAARTGIHPRVFLTNQLVQVYA